ncbi:MAG: LysR family transcriptional regulator [Magnetococcus sp. YQC-5]
MDLDLLRTFLEVHRTRHFGRASSSLFITQSAISTRIKQLEEILGVTLFTRKRNDIQLTPAGQRFLPSAESLLAAWEEARKAIHGSDATLPILTIGALPILWETLLPKWVTTLRQEDPTMTLCCSSHDAESLPNKLLDGAVDIGILLDIPKNKAFVIREMEPMPLILVSSRPDVTTEEAIQEVYGPHILVDWGRTFLEDHASWFSKRPQPGLQTDQSQLAYEWLLNQGGTAWLSFGQVESDLTTGRLFPVQDAATRHLTVYAVHTGRVKGTLIENALAHLV